MQENVMYNEEEKELMVTDPERTQILKGEEKSFGATIISSSILKEKMNIMIEYIGILSRDKKT